jgi:ring-1,2-phenylacetyl-CoA epoxidase subunit PaaD
MVMDTLLAGHTEIASPAMLSREAIWERLASVPDPEIPVISIVDLGIVRGVEVDDAGVCTVTLTPTYSGCPATEVIAADVRQALSSMGCTSAVIKTQLSPAWTTDWMNDETKAKLREYGIAPPHVSGVDGVTSRSEQRIGIPAIGGLQKNKIACPRCASLLTETLSQYGSTPCKAQYRCLACREPFDYFKPH